MDYTMIDNLYSLYRFAKQSESASCIIYLYEGGYFSNVEIFEKIKDSPENDTIYDEYKAIGHSVRKVYYHTYEEARDALFRGFFKINQTKTRLQQEYNCYCEMQTKQLGGDENNGIKYEYIKGSFFKDNGILPSQDDLIQTICDELLVDHSKLIILEAAAGYGKTCTSYEVLNMLLTNDTDNELVPLIAEMSKNRKAALFRYILQHEINNCFTGLGYETVIYEIKSGKIPVIIDGFDELLSKNLDSTEKKTDSINEEAQTMLDTIAQLFVDESKAKVVLTSRKSSIFVGDAFDKWVEEKMGNCEIVRIQIQEPTIEQWISNEKMKLLEHTGISLDVVPNPVLLAFIRSRDINQLTAKYVTADDILDSYFELLLSRERERQQILLPWKEQYNIMVSLAAQFVQLDISSEEKEFIKYQFSYLLSDKIPQYLAQYETMAELSSEMRPQSEEEFINKFVHHALLDRVSFTANKIGFINDFVFGVLIGEAVVSDKLSAEDMLSEKYIDICTTAYSTKNSETRGKLFNKLNMAIQCLNDQQQLNTDLILLNRLSRDYHNQAFELVRFKKNICLSGHQFENCTFHSCIFSRCKIPTSLFICCQFYDCKFYNIEVDKDTTDDRNLSFWGSSEGYDELAQAGLHVKTEIASDTDYNKKVLEQYLKPGYAKAELIKARTTLYRGFADSERENVDNAIEFLLDDGILIQMLRVLKLNTKKMNEINELLGR